MGVKRPDGLSRVADKVVLGVCVVISLWLISLDEHTRIERAAGWAHVITTPVEWGVHFFDGTLRLKKENERLRSQLAALELDAVQIAHERDRIEALQERAGFYEHSRGHIVPANVIELVVSRFPIQCKIRSLGVDSLQLWQPVVTERGLVGRIRQVLAPDLALVQMLTDPDSRVSIESARSGLKGLLWFDGRVFLMDHVPQGDPIEVGEELITSGIGGTVPRGLPVGTVSAVRSSPAELFQHVEVEPDVRFSALSNVYVVVRPGPWYSRRSDSELSPDAADSVDADAFVPDGGEEASR